MSDERKIMPLKSRGGARLEDIFALQSEYERHRRHLRAAVIGIAKIHGDCNTIRILTEEIGRLDCPSSQEDQSHG